MSSVESGKLFIHAKRYLVAYDGWCPCVTLSDLDDAYDATTDEQLIDEIVCRPEIAC